jgi:L-rhamnose mutarotase
MNDNKLETTVYELLESHSPEEIVFALFRYADFQARLATTLQQTEAADRWKHIAYELGSIEPWQAPDALEVSRG